MTRLVLHVGLSKTGTTAFQDFASANAGRLAERGLRYADILRGPNHSQLAVMFSGQLNQITESLGVHDERDRARLRARVGRRLSRHASRAPAWLMSSEQLSTMVRQPRRIAALSDFLHDYFDDVTVLVVVRRSDYWIPSSYVESVARGRTTPMDARFVRQREYFLHHTRLLRRWRQAFGVGAVHAVPFLETDKAEPMRLPARVLSAAGLSGPEVASWPTPPGVRNPALSAEAVEMLRLLNPRLELSALRPVSSRRELVAEVGRRRPGAPPALTRMALRELRRQRLVRSGVARSPFATGSGWSDWSGQPLAPVGPPPAVSLDEVDRLAEELLGDRGLDDLVPAAAASPLRRFATRTMRR